MRLFIITRGISFLIIALSILGCKAQLTENQNEARYVKQIDSLITKSYERDLFNGNVLVVKKDNIIYQKSFGYTDGTQQIKLNDKSIFNIGSIAKEFNGVAIMMLNERGLLNLDDTISNFNFGLPNWSEKVTVRHLLNYAGGIPQIDPLNPGSDEEAWNILKNNDSLLFKPGTDFIYDNSNVFLQRRIIEKVTGQSFEEFVIENILRPLKMTNSVFDPKENYDNRTSCYDFDNIKCPEMNFISGWLWLDMNDLSKWIEAMNSNVLISQKSFDTLLRNPYVKDKTSSIGEYFEEKKLQRHNGTSYKFESIFLNDFKNNITIILLSNHRNRVWDLGHTIHDIMLGKPYIVPEKSIYQAIRKESLKDVSKGVASYYLLKKNQPDEYAFEDPDELNKLGYELYRAGKRKELIDIFKLATTEFPNNANSFDSLGEAYYINEQYDLALASYNTAISLGGTNGNAEKMVNKIKMKNIK
ncbi:CubicO group peptidase (beta-lactamase class C family) [Gillisia sp. Hel_I_86]|uniref:serine hydrolase n=1 Tax=Gillisia sp. Hel_I_86 TaxID=1249981 RepID=UPI00119A8AE4|nr:serine hydrolase [Gillisia sp. Hel_I_86]TVZ25829.1 CubicO group peptidase (beta-lactamase class C family) [Gillisia sp. Hel_I_86]